MRALDRALVGASLLLLVGACRQAMPLGARAEASGAAARPVDELLILERPPGSFLDDGGDGDLGGSDAYGLAAPDRDPRRLAGTGSLVVEEPGRTVVVPLAHTAVRGEVRGDVAAMTVTQQFENPYDRPIEAVYVFPLPTDAAVGDFLMTIGERTIRGVVREREEARRLYEAARRQGVAASLLTQERPNVFTQKVANIAPGGAIDVSIEYVHRLRYRDGEYELVFPMVVGPRYQPAGATDGVGAVTLATRGTSGQPVEVPYLRPDERSGHDVSLELDLDPGVPIQSLDCPTHALEVERPDPRRARVRLAAADRIPNRDLVLRYRVAGEDVRSALQVARTAAGGWARLTVLPPADLARLPARPIELIGVVDTSGSMDGAPLRQARAALHDALARLGPDDTFQLIRFSNGARALEQDPLPGTPANLRRGRAFIDALRADGGTEMLSGVRAALGREPDAGRERLVVFLTDGYIGNEEEVLREVRRAAGTTRVFSFGVGSSVNRFLMEAMAREGRGAAAFLGLDEDAQAVMGRLFERLRRPAMVDLEVDWGGLAVAEVYPSELPDLFVGRPVELVARLAPGADPAGVAPRVLGQVGRATRAVDVAVNRIGEGPGARALALVWAREKIADLGSRLRRAGPDEQDALRASITATALEHGILCATTAFVAVDSLTRVEGEAQTVPVAVPVPDGVRFETTVGDGGPR